MKVIVFTNEIGSVSVCTPTGEIPIEQVKLKDTPEHSIIVNSDELPFEHNVFFDAWEIVDSKVIVNLPKAKTIAHDMRRAAREEEFKPLDAVIMKQIPGVDAAQAEADRQAIRDKYATMQAAIDAATNTNEIKEALQ